MQLARYFLRKLQNDGIEAKIWTLVPTENGVSAQAGSSKQRIQFGWFYPTWLGVCR